VVRLSNHDPRGASAPFDKLRAGFDRLGANGCRRDGAARSAPRRAPGHCPSGFTSSSPAVKSTIGSMRTSGEAKRLGAGTVVVFH
jgi:hypothetical protein